MKKLARLLSLILCLTMIFSSIACNGGKAEEKGISFEAPTSYVMEKAPLSTPKTFEIVYKLEDYFLERAGVLVGNYNGFDQAINVEIYQNGKPRFFYQDGLGKVYQYVLACDTRDSDWVHLAITWDFSTLKFYINGTLLQETILEISQEPIIKNPYAIGGDLRTDNKQYFKGQIASVALFDQVRSDEEIKADYDSFNKDSNGLMAYYQLSKKNNNPTLTDFSGNGFNLTIKSDWIESVSEPDDYEFSFMAIGDTQILTYHYPDKLKDVYDYVLDNVKRKKVKHVFGLGDITDDDKKREWETATAQIFRMDGIVPYSVIRGNHDIYSAGTSMNVLSYFDANFGSDTSPYAKQYVDYYKGYTLSSFKARNTVHKFSSSTRDYLVIALDYGADDDILAWATSVVESHPNHNVIVTTHSYINAKSKFVNKASGGAYPTRDYPKANDGDDMWEEFISQHENIVMVLCGHSPTSNVLLRKSTGVNGNEVAEILIDPQGLDETMKGMGMVATFYVSKDGKTITVDYYSTINKKYYKQNNQYTFQVETVERA